MMAARRIKDLHSVNKNITFYRIPIFIGDSGGVIDFALSAGFNFERWQMELIPFTGGWGRGGFKDFVRVA